MVRGHRLSDDLRKTLVYMKTAQGLRNSDIAKITNLSLRTIGRVLSEERARGAVERPRTVEQRGRKRALTRTDINFLIGCLEKKRDMYLVEMQEALRECRGVQASESAIWRALVVEGYTLKKTDKRAMERNEDLRAQFKFEFGSQHTAAQTVCVDESCVDRRTANRRRAWAKRGQRAFKKVFFVRGRRYSILPAISLDGILHATIVEGSFTSDTFYDFIDGLLDKMQPYPLPNSVVVMDNCRIHKDPRILNLIVTRGMRYMFLPPYSPDLNPIELAFSVIKSYIRSTGELLRTDVDSKVDDTYVYVHLYESVFAITADQALGFFHHCGYV